MNYTYPVVSYDHILVHSTGGPEAFNVVPTQFYEQGWMDTVDDFRPEDGGAV